ncbi:helix-turn-helix domain-containing protein [Paenibacillus validus]|uniref:Helix-turn-helix domain-containing protein n=1 Tax=Paenibacillus validus TaxID=44253 RepID=A0A7X3CS18_9BACL|nr:helix-turn-helix domain-containing protein [Paenibacillus validus]MED4601085.1 helix-turn-helix domain-containing protein [Paenibacillus validus]MED4607444.1 helix-turn-helix domain-containing protein [Paenibacillus validus]MUG70301.1 helix-turn-helix domain-containing protein [Paenibacillus validus]
MTESKADLILHPVRLKIIQALIQGRKLTRQQLSALFPDIPQATMYRHLNKLEQAGLIVVVEQRKQRGAKEKWYAIGEHAESVPNEELTAMSAEEHMELFMKFVSGLIGDFGRYVAQDEYDMQRDGISMRQTTLYLSDDEYRELFEEIKASLMRRMDNGPAPDRRRRAFTNIVIPEPKRKQEESP